MAYTTINKSSDHFNTKLYTGNNSTNNITGVGFQPGWLWIKSRGSTENHVIYDALRGVTKQLYPNTSGAENTNATALTAFGTDGFNLATSNANTNANGVNFVSWNWKAGGGAGSSNTSGTINTTNTSVNSTAGFSISTYTGNGTDGATVGHGLGVAPTLVIIKNRSTSSRDWIFHHPHLATNQVLFLNSTAATQVNSGGVADQFNANTIRLNDGSGGAQGINHSGDNYVMYAFVEKVGYSKFGKYNGNGSSAGPFIYCGFKPKFLLIRNQQDSGEYWEMFDDKRIGYNPKNNRIYPNATDAEDTSDERLDLVSNGFKLRNSGSHINEDGDKIIFMAFGQTLVGSNNVPCTAR